eukprot:447478_1
MSTKLLQNDNLHLFTYRKSKKSGLSYKIIAIDKDDGPYIYKSTNEYKVDACYHLHDPIYSVSIANILQEEMVEIHDCILYNKYKWSLSFKNWFHSKCIKIAPRAKLNSIIFESNRYILVTWVAPKATRFAYPGYEKLVAVCGGPSIDVNKIIDADLNFVFENNTIWYVDSGEPFEIVSDSNKSIMEKFYSVMQHTKKIKSIAVLQTSLRKASTKLQIAKYGEKYYHETNVPLFIWNDYLKTELHRFNVKTTKRGKTVRWKMGYGVADCIAKLAFFTKTYYDPFDNGKIIVFASNIKASFNLVSGRMIFK